jgi:hypothetical protein
LELELELGARSFPRMPPSGSVTELGQSREMPPWGNGDCTRDGKGQGRVMYYMHFAYMHTYAMPYTVNHSLLLPHYLNLSKRARFIAI